MLKAKVEKALNEQIHKEIFSSQLYLSMASWCEVNGYAGCASWLYEQADEERLHMLKIFKYVNDRGGRAIVTGIDQPQAEFQSAKEIFEKVLEHEMFISASINDLVGVCVDEKDFTTNSFLQWYVNEQIEEESTAKTLLDQLNLLGDDKAKMYLFDRDIVNFRQVQKSMA